MSDLRSSDLPSNDQGRYGVHGERLAARRLDSMSEYQCYEFVALDAPLSSRQMAELRAVSTRADITSTRFWNEYHWGDLKADPLKLVMRYFDAHAYFANWGTRRLMLRISAAQVDPKLLRTYFPGGAARLSVAGTRLVLDLTSDEEEPRDDFSPGSPLAPLTPIRAEIAQGDLRAAYLSWLLAVQAGDVRDGALEPLVPDGLSTPSVPQRAMIEFLRIDPDLIGAAAARSRISGGDGKEFRGWVSRLSAGAKDQWLQRAVAEPELALGGELLRAFRKEKKVGAGASRRTVRELRDWAEVRRQARERVEAARVDKARRAAEAVRAKRLDALAHKVDAAWARLEALIEKSAYDDALALALDLRDVAMRDGAIGAFGKRFKAMRKRRIHRRGFFDRWKRANDPEQ